MRIRLTDSRLIAVAASDGWPGVAGCPRTSPRAAASDSMHGGQLPVGIAGRLVGGGVQLFARGGANVLEFPQ